MRRLWSFLLPVTALFHVSCAWSGPAHDLVISTQDGKYQRTDGAGLTRRPPAPDSVVVIDTRQFPPKIVTRIDQGIEQTIAGPPQSVAITPDGELALLGAPSRLDADGKTVVDSFLQVVALTEPHRGVIARLPMNTTIQGIAINRQGTLALACGVDGQLRVLRLQGREVTLLTTLHLAPRRLASVVFTPDGRHALVSRRDDGGIAVLDVDREEVRPNGQILAIGLAPYALDVSSDGRWMVTGNVGLAGLPDFTLGQSTGDADTITLYDLSKQPFQAVDFATTPTLPEGIALSPDGKWVAVQSMDGSFLPHNQPGHSAHGSLTLFRNDHGHLVQTGHWASGIAGQGLAFAHGGDMLLVQRNVEHEIAVYRRIGGTLTPTGTVFHVGGGPVAINTLPR